MPTADEVREGLKPVEDPEIHLSIVDLGLIYGVEVQDAPEGSNVQVNMTLTSPACPYGPMLLGQVHATVQRMPGVATMKVNLVWNPPWDPRTMASEEAKMELGIS